jgi:hypothetical protein
MQKIIKVKPKGKPMWYMLVPVEWDRDRIYDWIKFSLEMDGDKLSYWRTIDGKIRAYHGG